MKRFILLLLLVPFFVFAEPLYSPTWGFFLDLPEAYEYIDGDGRDRFSFQGPAEAMFDLVVYNGTYANMTDLITDINRRLSNRGDYDFFEYRDKQAAVLELNFGEYTGWGICVEFTSIGNQKPMLLALAYGPADLEDLDFFHMSALDSICPSIAERKYPGPIMEYGFPRGRVIPITLAGGVSALIRENDAEAAQVLVEREYRLLEIYFDSPYLAEAWRRYYRFIYRDSWDRVTNAVTAVTRSLGGHNAASDEAKRAFAQRALSYVQGFDYERDPSGSDFVNIVSAITESRGDCDSRSLLWAIMLAHADIRAAMMVSPHYSHAMGLADITGIGARFDAYGTRWLVAETTDKVDIGLIAQDVSDPQYWLGILFE